MTFATYKVLFLHNVCLGDNNITKAIKMVSIVVGVERSGIKNRVCIIDVLYVPKLQTNLLSVNNFLLNALKV